MFKKTMLCLIAVFISPCYAQSLGINLKEFVQRYEALTIANGITNARFIGFNEDKRLAPDTVQMKMGEFSGVMAKVSYTSKSNGSFAIESIIAASGSGRVNLKENYDALQMLSASVAVATGISFQESFKLLVLQMGPEAEKRGESHRKVGTFKVSWLKNIGAGTWILVQPCDLAEVPCKK